MTTRPCNLCNLPGSVCPNHATDPNRPAQLFPGVDDPFPAGLQGFHSPVQRPDLGWLAGASPHQEEPQVHPSQPGFGYMDLLRSTCDPSKIPLDLSWSLEISDEEASPSPSPSPQPPPPVNEIVPSSSTMPPFPWATFTTYSSETSREAADNNSASTNGLEAQAVETAMDREARVQRYKEKRKRRKFQKQIRYASRKAYAEVRPRVKGRFAKAADANSTSNQLDMGWFHP